MAERTKTSLFVDPDIFRETKIKALREGLTLSDALEAALRAWNGKEEQKTPFASLSAKDRALVERIAELARLGERERIEAIRLVAKIALPREVE